MKILVAEHISYLGHPADAIFDQSARDTFKQSRAIPDGLRIWIAMQRGEKWITGFHRHATGLGVSQTLPPPPHSVTRIENVQAVTWGIWRLLIYLSATTSPDVYPFLELDGSGPLNRLWRLDNNVIVWPPAVFVGDAFVDDLTGLWSASSIRPLFFDLTERRRFARTPERDTFGRRLPRCFNDFKKDFSQDFRGDMAWWSSRIEQRGSAILTIESRVPRRAMLR